MYLFNTAIFINLKETIPLQEYATPDQFSFLTPFKIDPNNNNIMYLANGRVLLVNRYNTNKILKIGFAFPEPQHIQLLA